MWINNRFQNKQKKNLEVGICSSHAPSETIGLLLFSAYVT